MTWHEKYKKTVAYNHQLKLEIKQAKIAIGKLESKRAVIRQVNIDRMLRIDSNLNKAVIESCIKARAMWNNRQKEPCPLTQKGIQCLSRYLRENYEEKEKEIKKQFNFKPNDE